MITAKDIDLLLTEAIKRFGTYPYHDKGAEEIMDVYIVVEQLEETKDPQYVLSVLKKLNKKKRNAALVRELVTALCNNEFFGDIEDPIIEEYY